MAVISYTIKPEHLGLIGYLVPSEVTALSPLKKPVKGALAAAKTELCAAGVTEDSGALTGQAAKTFGKLAKTASSFAITFLGLPSALEYVLYFPAGEKEPLSLAVKAGSLALDDPARPEQLAGFLKDCMGGSSLSAGNFKTELSSVQALVLAALLDMHRRVVFEALGKETVPPEPISFTYAELRAALDSDPRPSWQWLRGHVAQLLDTAKAPGEDDTIKTVRELAEAGTIQVESAEGRPANLVCLSSNLSYAAESLGTIKGALVASLHMEREGKVYNAGFTALQGGVYNLLYLEKSSEGVKLEAISPARVMIACSDMVSAAADNALRKKEPAGAAQSAVRGQAPGPEKAFAEAAPVGPAGAGGAVPTQFFLSRRGIEVGPFSREQVGNMLKEGSIKEEEMLRPEGQNKWLPAKSIARPGP